MRSVCFVKCFVGFLEKTALLQVGWWLILQGDCARFRRILCENLAQNGFCGAAPCELFGASEATLFVLFGSGWLEHLEYGARE